MQRTPLLYKLVFAAIALFTIALVIIVVVKGRESNSGATPNLGIFSGTQSKARDTERSVDMKALQGQLEVYYATSGNYPSRANLNDTAWVSQNMRDLDREALRDPQSSSYTLVASPAAHVYSYAVTNAAGASCESTPTDCTKYTLTATYEAGNTYVLSNVY